MSVNVEKINIRGVNFDNVTVDEAFEKVKSFVSCDGVSVMVTPNSEIVQNCIENPYLFDVINSADLIIPDGIGVIYASKILSTPLKEKVAGCVIGQMLLEYAAQTGVPVFFFGGGKADEKSPCVAQIAADKMKDKYQGLNVCGVRDGYFTQSDNDEIIRQINSSGAKILYVCLGAPKQELWLYQNKDKLNVNFAACLGGTLDVFAGKANRAPDIFIKLNLEWFYRLIKNPSRIGRMMSLPKFIIGTILSKGKKR